MKVMKHFTVCALFFLAIACSDEQTPSKDLALELQIKLPAKPVNSPAFLNTSSLQSINEVAIIELRRASEYTGIDFSMLLVDELPDQISIEIAAAQLFDEWQVGAETQGKGVLFLFVEKDGLLKIEVGYELEGVFPDAFVGSFQETLRDYYRGEYFGDVVGSMITSMMRRAQGEDAKGLMESFSNERPQQQGVGIEKAMGFRSGGAGVTESNFVINKEKKLNNTQQLSDKSRAQYDKNAQLNVVIQRYLKSLQAGVNDPYLPLLTEGSQMMRLEYPKNAGFQRRAYKRFSGKYKVQQSGDLAAVRFQRPDVMPILFRKDSQGNWLADITKSWAYSQASRDLKKMYPAMGDHAWMFAWKNELRKPVVPPTPAPLAKGKSLDAEILRLEKAIQNLPKEASNYFALADLLYFECYWIRDAMKLIEKGLLLDPANVLYHKRFISFAYRFPDMSRVEHHHEQIFQHDPGDYENLRLYISYLKRKRSTAYEAKINLLRKAKGHLVVPDTPFPMNSSSGKYRNRVYHLGSATRQLQARYNFFVMHKHDAWAPLATIYFYDEKLNAKFGIAMKPKESGLLIRPLTSSPFKFTPFTLPLTKIVKIDCSWGESERFVWSINDRRVLVVESELVPSVVKVFQRSGGGIFSLDEN
ncbi:MAG: TPM domain-containing protein [Verrucomicrobiales bacterium]|nr:TPM domain-containing protein [Verrucomicrobiales bacterium]